MVAFNFKEQFADDVEAGRKLQSIRETQRCKPGDTIQLYTGMRTKKCRKLGEAICLQVEPVEITEDVFYVCKHRFPYTTQGALDQIANDDGFKTFWDMKKFFRNIKGLPFKGFVHTWKPAPPTGNANEKE